MRSELKGIAIRAVDLIMPYEQVYDWSCGPASLHIAYNALGRDISEDQLIKEADCNEDGTEWKEMLANPSRHGFGVWEGHKADYDDLSRLVQVIGYPVIVPWYSSRGKTPDADHYSVIKRISPLGVLLADPGQGDYFPIQRDEFIKRWTCNGNNRDYLVVVPQL